MSSVKAELQHHGSGPRSPAHILISTSRLSPTIRSPQSSPFTCTSSSEQQSLHRHHGTSSTPITATGISSAASRGPALMPAPNHPAAQHLFRPAASSHNPAITSQSAQQVASASSDTKMSSNMLPQPAQPQTQPQTSNGPISRPVQVPARAKPGRKAMDNSEKEDRRRKQNRNAQRNYRDRRSQQVAELSDEVKELQQQSRDAYNQHLQEMQRLLAEQQQIRAEMQKAREESQRWMDKASYFERAFSQVATSLPRDERERFRELPPPPTSEPPIQLMRVQAPLPDFSTISLPPLSAEDKMGDEAMPPTPPEDSPNETDFTQVWLQNRGASSSQQHSDAPHGNDDLTMSCGFCSDSDYCPCKEAADQPVPAMPAPAPSAAKSSSTGPGTCEMCQQDPERAAACRSLAGRTKPSKSPPAATSDKTMNCGQFIDRANNNLGRMPSIAEILGPLHSYPAAKGFDVNEQEAAVVLQHLSTQPSP